MTSLARGLSVAVLTFGAAGPAAAQGGCGGDFDAWLDAERGRTRDLQRHFVREGLLPEDEVDGKLGIDTRKVTRKAQLKLGHTADGYPNVELLQAMASRG